MGKTVDITSFEPGSNTTGGENTSGAERAFAEVLADLVGIDPVPAEANFFDDLGADSMLMARFCARVRKRTDLPSVSMKDVYRNPTIRRLAAAVGHTDGDRGGNGGPVVLEAPVVTGTGPVNPVRGFSYVLCGVLQFLFFAAYAYVAGLITEHGYDWVSGAADPLHIYLRSVVLGALVVAGLFVAPILAKWILVGRWRPMRFRVWSLTYVRFWIVKTMIRFNPLLLLIGGRSRSSTTSPLYSWYLRALGAKIGSGAAIYSRNVPVCTDLLTLGENAVIRKDTFFNCYRARAGMIEIGPVTLGRDAYVGELTVLDIDTELGDGAQLDQSSTLHSGQSVPAGQRWQGSPAHPAGPLAQPVPPVACGAVRRAVFAVGQLVNIMLLYVPLIVGGVALLLVGVPQLGALLGTSPVPFTGWQFYRDAAITSFALLFGAGLLGLIFACTVPRLLNRAVKPGQAYRLYGFHYWAHRTIARATNLRFFVTLFGDSSFVVHYLSALGYKLKPVVQTGCNFGMLVKHENPFAVRVGGGTIVADGLSIVNAQFSNTSFQVTPATIGGHSFVGNHIAYPSGSRVGDNCLLATKVLVPVDGPGLNDTGVLGAPGFEIPRSVQRDNRFDHLTQPEELRRRLRAKNKYDLRTMGWLLLSRWVYLFLITLAVWLAVEYYGRFGALVLALATLVTVTFSVIYFSLVERASNGFRRLRPRYCSIYDRYFWWHERYWKLSLQPKLLDGTPFKVLAWRLLGVRVGKHMFDDGIQIMEKTLVTIGDDCTFNIMGRLQCHSQEDGTFKSDRIRIGSGCTVGTHALLHYGSTMGDGAELAPDAFLMKGEEIPAHEVWAGNPARAVRTTQQLRPVTVGGR